VNYEWLMKMDRDLIIVGGGPGGTAAAITAKQMVPDLQVLLIERSPFPRHRPGETLHPGIEPLLQQLGVWDEVLAADFPRHTGHWVAWGEPRQFQPFGQNEDGTAWQGFQAWRATFDTLLLTRARGLDVEIWQPCQAHNVLTLNQRVQGVVCKKNGELIEVSAPYLIDAGGGSQWLARKLSLPIEYHSSQLLLSYGYATGQLTDDNSLPLLAADEHGWSWSAKVGTDRYHWARLDFRSPPLKPQLPNALLGLTAEDKVYGADVTWRSVSQPAGLGYFMVGDAAALFDPTSSHGVLRAMMSGIYAGHLVGKRLAGKVGEGQVSDIYRAWIRRWVEHEVKNLRAAYAILRSTSIYGSIPRF